MLATSAQWEYACRAGTTSDYAGNLDDMAWYNQNSGGKIYLVGTKQPNAFGLYDMHGNIWEWCLDWYSEQYYDECNQKGVVDNPTGPKTGSYRLLRGGLWDDSAADCRCASRGNRSPGIRSSYVGFRLVFVP